MLWGKVLVWAHLCFHRNSNSFQCTCLWYLKRIGERLFEFAWQDSLMWAICYINAWTPIPGIVNGCPGLVACLPEEHLSRYLWQREKYLFCTFPYHSPNPFSTHFLFLFFLFCCWFCFLLFFLFPILGDCKKQTEGHILFLRVNAWQFSGRLWQFQIYKPPLCCSPTWVCTSWYMTGPESLASSKRTQRANHSPVCMCMCAHERGGQGKKGEWYINSGCLRGRRDHGWVGDLWHFY